MIKENSFNLLNIRKKLVEEQNEVLYPESDFLKLEISPAEKMRYETNTKMAKVGFEELNALINGEIELGSIEKRSQELMKQLNPAQQDLLKNITETIMKGGGVSLEGIYSRQKLDTLQDKYINNREKHIEYFRAGVSKKVNSKVRDEDIKLMPWGAVVVHINDEEAWQEIYDPKNEKGKDTIEFVYIVDLDVKGGYSSPNVKKEIKVW